MTGKGTWRDAASAAFIAIGLALGCSESVPSEHYSRIEEGLETLNEEILSDEEAARLEEPEAPVNVTMTAEMGNGEVLAAAVTPSDYSIEQKIEHPPKRAVPIVVQSSKISKELANKAGSELDVLIEYRSDIRIPRMPRAADREPRDSAENTARTLRAAGLIRWVQNKRKPTQDKHVLDLVSKGARVKERFWLMDAISATIPTTQLAAIAADPEVIAIDPEHGGKATSNPAATGRSMLHSDPYYSTANMNTGYIGVVGSGINKDHDVLVGRTSWVRDCVIGNQFNCLTSSTGATPQPWDHADHETAVAAVMSGTAALGASNRGVTGIYLDSFRVSDAIDDFSGPAITRAFQASIAGLDNVINASFSWNGATITSAAEGAFDAGAIVVASAGNDGGTPANEIGNPATARKVICVGAVDQNKVRWSASSTGPAPDGRTKPDLMALGVNVTLADALPGNTFSEDCSGTSFAAPFVSGAAALLRRWMTSSMGNGVEAGHVYAMLIASGQGGNGSVFDNNMGAGNLALPTSAGLYAGKVSVSNGQTINNNINIASGSNLDVAIWWPETSATHNDIDLYFKKPDGTTAAYSASGAGIWEKVYTPVTATGTWNVSIQGYAVTGTQTVYWAAIRR